MYEMFYSRIIVCLSVLILLTGCIQNSENESALVLAGSNRSELEAVLLEVIIDSLPKLPVILH